jgi:hypothetical protein
MALSLLPAPDVAAVSLGGAAIGFIEPLGFSADNRQLLVHVSFTDDGDPGSGLHHGVWLYDLQQQAYTLCLNDVIAGTGASSGVDVKSAVIAGSGSTLRIVALSQTRGNNEDMAISQIDAGALTRANVVTAVLNEVATPVISALSLTADGRFLAVQTDSPLLAPEQAIDSNETRDIYLIDLQSLQTRRVTLAGGEETFAPATLGRVFSDANTVRVAFVSEAAFVSTSKDKNSAPGADTAGHAASDLYVWSSAFNTSGFTGVSDLRLASVTPTGVASGLVDPDLPVGLTAQGAWFSSTSNALVSADANNSVDAFLYAFSTATVERLRGADAIEFSGGAVLAGVSSSGQSVALLTTSPDVVGPSGVQQLVLLDRNKSTTTLLSSSTGAIDGQANDLILNAALSPSGITAAYSTAADNLVPDVMGNYGVYVSSTVAQTLTGQAYFWNKTTAQGSHAAGHVLMSQVTMAAVEQTTETDALGQYSLPLASSDALTVTALRSTTDTAMQASIKAAINLSDVLDCLKLYLGKTVASPSPYKLVAADLDANGKIDLTDVLNLLKNYLGKTASATPKWAFVNEVASLSAISKSATALPVLQHDPADGSALNLVAVLRGDVNGSWKPAVTEDYTTLPDSYFTDPGVGLVAQQASVVTLGQFGLL